MMYPVYVHKEEESSFGVTIPDLPGCFSAADSQDELQERVQEAVELYFEGEELEIPEPSSLDDLVGSPDYEGGFWLLLEIDLERIRPKVERVNITLPRPLLAKIDSMAKREHMSRSGFIAMAASKAIQQSSGSESSGSRGSE